MVEGTRLEVVCARDGTEGSNPSLSVPGAMQNQLFEPRQVWKEAAVDWSGLCRSFPGFFIYQRFIYIEKYCKNFFCEILLCILLAVLYFLVII